MFLRLRTPYILNVITSSLVPLVNFGAVLLTTPVLLSALGRGNYGLWLFFFALTQWFNLARFGLDTALVRKLASLVQNPEAQLRVYQLVGTLFWTTFGIGAVVWGIGFGGLPWLSEYLKHGGMDVDPGKKAFLILMAAFVTGYVSLSFESLLYAAEEYFVKNMLSILVTVLQTAWILYIFRSGGNLVNLAWVYLVFAALQLLLLVALVNKKYRIGGILRHFHFSALHDIRGWSLQYFLISLAAVVIYKTDNIVIGLFVSAEAVAVYGISFKLIDQAFRLNWNLGEMLYPRISRLHAEGRVGEVKKMRDLILGLTLLGTLITGAGLFWLGPHFVKFWVGSENLLEEHVFRLLIITLLLGAVAHNCGVFINGVGWQKPMVVVCGIEAILNLGISLALVQPYGYFGVALGTFVAHVLTTAWFNPYLALQYGRKATMQEALNGT